MSIPPLSTEDLEHAASIVHRVYSNTNPDDQQLAQKQLFELQQRVEAWSLVLPFLQHDDPNLQFIGAHTAQVKIARDWDTLPREEAEPFRQSFVGIVGHAAVNGRNKTVMRKLYVALVSLALKLGGTSPPQWPDWVVSSLRDLLELGLPSENLLDYLTIVAEEAHRSDLTGSARVHLSTSIRNAVPVVSQAAGTALSDISRSLPEKFAALRCLEAWTQQLPGEQLGQIIPVLLTSLSIPDLFVAASDVISEFMASSALGGGAGTRVLTEPLLMWVEAEGRDIFQSSLETETIDDVSRGLCKMLVAVGDHSLDYIVKNIHAPSVLAYLEILLGFTGFPGWYGVDEFESDLTISFWVYFGEGVLSSDWNSNGENSEVHTAQNILLQLVRVLQKKCTWPPQEELRSWTKDQKETFSTYRRDVGESMVNAYYVLRDETLRILVEVVLAGLNSPDPQTVNWEEVESSLHCIDCCQDGVPLQKNTYLEQLVEALPGIPTGGNFRLRQTTINLIGDYSTWFTDQPTPLLLSALNFVVAGLQEPALSLQASGALKQLCDANRTKLAPHIASFGEIHSAAAKISKNADRAKVIESIASVVEALPPVEGVAPTLAIIRPIVQDWGAALQGATQYPEDARLLVEQQVRLLSSCAKGLSPAQDTFTYEDADTSESALRVAGMDAARSDAALAEARQTIVGLLRETMSYWSTDSELSDAISDLIRSITSLPLEVTLVSLPAAPLLELVCLAADRQLTGVWLTLVSRLVVQLEPPSFISLKTEPGGDTKQLVDQAARSIVISSMRVLQMPGVMEENPDLVQAFFSCAESITHTFMRSIMVLPPELSNSLMECATRAVSLQERYSLVAGCKFLVHQVTFVKRSASDDTLNETAQHLLATHAQHITEAIVNGIAGDAPRSAVPNLAAVLSAFVLKFPAETRAWLQQSIQNPRLAENPRVTPQAKETFLKTINASRSSGRMLTAANDFSLLARGLKDTSYAAGQVLWQLR